VCVGEEGERGGLKSGPESEGTSFRNGPENGEQA